MGADGRYVVFWSAKAQQRLIEILDWIGRRDASAALRVVGAIERDVGRLADHPLLGASAEPPRAVLGARVIVSGDHLVYYDVDEARREVIILTVRHGRQAR